MRNILGQWTSGGQTASFLCPRFLQFLSGPAGFAGFLSGGYGFRVGRKFKRVIGIQVRSPFTTRSMKVRSHFARDEWAKFAFTVAYSSFSLCILYDIHISIP